MADDPKADAECLQRIAKDIAATTQPAEAEAPLSLADVLRVLDGAPQNETERRAWQSYRARLKLRALLASP